MTNTIRDIGQILPDAIGRQQNKPAASETKPGGKSFGDALESALRGVDQELGAADRTAEAYITGQGGDLHNVMIELEQADLQFRTMLQVRNKLLDAYKDIMRMSV